jgi:tetratricopeptide (TPR) repeat protein
MPYFRLFTVYLLIISLITSAKAQEKDYETAYQQAIKAFNEGKKKEGYEALNKSIGINPTFYDALYARSFYYRQDGELGKALNDYDLLVLLYPENPTLHLYRGQVQQELENYAEAESDFLQAYAIDSTDTDITNSLGSLYFLMELYEDALSFLNKSIALNPKDFYAFYYRSYTYYLQQKYTEALNNIQTCETSDAQDVDVQRLKAKIFLGQKQYKNAIGIFEKLQARNVDFQVEDFLDWGMAYFDQKRYQDAMFYFDLPQKHDNADLYYYLGKTRYLLNDTKKAILKLDSAIVLYHPESESAAKAFYDRAIVHFKTNNLKKAEIDFLKACYLMPEIWQQRDAESNRLDLLGDAYTLLKMSQKQAKVDSARIRGFQDRGEALVSAGDTNRALSEVQKAILLDTLNAHSVYLKGKFNILSGRYQEGLSNLDHAQRLSKEQSLEDILYVKALAYNALKNYAEAKKHILRAIEINAKEASYWNDLAAIEYNAGEFRNALLHSNAALERDKENLNYYNDRALYHWANQEFTKAINDADKVLKAESDNLAAYYHRGLAYKGLQKYSEAIEDFNQILKAFPDEAEVLTLRKECMKKMETEKPKK